MSQTLHVLFRVADANYVLAATDVLHMDAFTGATPVPGAPPHVAGLVQVRGRVVPVVDLRARFGAPARQSSPEARVVVVQQGERVVALLADSAREVVRIDAKDFRETPDMMADAGQGFVKSVARVGDRLLMLLDLPKVIGEEPEHGG
jgi:purine-binding chemotaxis protein CheW